MGKDAGRNGRKRKAFVGSVLFMCLAVFLFTGCGSREEEIPMGRYNEREVKTQGGGFSYMHPLPDGGYYLYGNKVALTKVEADGTASKQNWLWENNVNIDKKWSFGVADDGAVIFGYVPRFFKGDDYGEIFDENGEYRYLYCYVDVEGEKNMLDLHGSDWSVWDKLEYFAFAPDHRIYAASSVGCYRVNVESGEVETLFDTQSGINEFAFMGDTMIAMDQDKAWLYDMAAGKLLEDNAVLDEFVAAHQTGGKSIVLAAKQDEGQEILYLGCRTGLYRYVWGGSVIEQIADGQMLSLSDSQYSPKTLQLLPNDEFRLYMSGNHLVELFYDETVPSRPARELAIYSLKENDRIRYAARLFQKQHPDVAVQYETGTDGDMAVSEEDALRNLSTALLAGESPDILILDGMDIGQYAKKGVLRPLDDFIAPYEEDGILYQGILDGMRKRCGRGWEENADQGALYAIPLNVFLPLYVTERKYLEGEDSLADLTAGLEIAREENPDGPLLFTPTKEILLRQLTLACEPAWTREDGSLDTEKIREYYETACRLWELDNMSMTPEQRAAWQENSFEKVLGGEENYLMYSLTQSEDTYFYDDCGAGQTAAVLGCLTGGFGLFSTGSLYFHLTNWDHFRKDAEEIRCDKYIGQASDVYLAQSIMGLCEDAKEPELAEEFLTLCLSAEMQNKWWLDNGPIGVAIRKESFAAVMDINNREYASVRGWDKALADTLYSERIFPNEEYQEWFFSLMEDAKTAYLPGLSLEKTVEEVGLLVLDGEFTPQEGAAEVERRMAIEMEE